MSNSFSAPCVSLSSFAGFTSVFILELSAVPQFVLCQVFWPPLHLWPASLWGTVVEWISQNVTGPVPDYSSLHTEARYWLQCICQSVSVCMNVTEWMRLVVTSASSVQLEIHYIRLSLFTISCPSLPRICFNLSSAVSRMKRWHSLIDIHKISQTVLCCLWLLLL